MKRFGLLMAVAFMLNAVQPSGSNAARGIAMLHPLASWDPLVSACDEQIQVNDFWSSLSAHGYAQGDFVVYWNFQRTNTPSGTAEDLVNEASSSRMRTFFELSHSATNYLATEFHLTTTGRNNQVAYYLNTLNWNPSDIGTATYKSGGAIVLSSSGIQRLIRPNLNPKAMVVLTSCQGGALRNSFCSNLSPGGQTFIAYLQSVKAALGCSNLNYMTQALSCQLFPGVNNDATEVTRYLAQVQVWGDPLKRLDDTGDCHGWAWFAKVWFADGLMGWSAISEEGSRYNLRAYKAGSSTPETIGTVVGLSGDALGKVRSYTFPVPSGSGYVAVDVVETDSKGKVTVSPKAALDSGAKPDNWEWLVEHNDQGPADLAPEGDDSALELVNGEFVPFLPGSFSTVQSDECQDCADEIVVSSNPLFLQPYGDQVASWRNENGDLNRVRMFLVSRTIPEVTRQVLATVLDANQAWNGQGVGRQYPVDPGPTLNIAGDQTVVFYQTFPNPPEHPCTQPTCKSWLKMTDIDGDGSPDCPVNVLIADRDSISQVLLGCDASNRWNSGTDVAPGVPGLFLAGDVYDSSSAPWMGQDLQAVETDLYAQLGRASQGVLCESNFPIYNWDTMHDAWVQKMAQGVGAIWYMDFFGSVTSWSPFIVGSRINASDLLQRKQVYTGFGGSCEGGGLFWGDVWGQPLAKKLMFTDPDGSVMAACIVNANAANGADHRAGIRELAVQMRNAPARRSMATVNFLAARALAPDYPTYAAGLVSFGAFTYAWPNSGSNVGVPEDRNTMANVRLWASAGALHLSLPTSGRLSLSVFDITGRLVSQLTNGDELSSGLHSFPVQSLSSGVYLARVGFNGASSSRKFVIAR